MRFPAPGKAKTRLIPAIGPERAARVSRRLGERALAAARASGLPWEVRFTGASAAAFRALLGDVPLAAQGPGDLGDRMLRALAPGPAMIVGSDVPGMEASHLTGAAALLARRDLVIGPAHDGGYWLIGMRQPAPELFDGIAWGTGTVLERTLANARTLGIGPALAARLHDLDRPADLRRWPELAR